jgi:hypothetical protein
MRTEVFKWEDAYGSFVGRRANDFSSVSASYDTGTGKSRNLCASHFCEGVIARTTSSGDIWQSDELIRKLYVCVQHYLRSMLSIFLRWTGFLT